MGYQFGVPGVSDGISMGTSGMSFSLQSRDLIADAVETVAGGHWLDGMVVVPVSTYFRAIQHYLLNLRCIGMR